MKRLAVPAGIALCVVALVVVEFFALQPKPPSKCIPWQRAGQYAGSYQCICGSVDYTLTSGDKVFSIHFGTTNTAFYAYSADYYWEKGVLEGSCLAVCGVVDMPSATPSILVNDIESQVFDCPWLPW